MALLDATGSNIVARYEYDPWGNVLSVSGLADICPFRWQTKYFDNETGLYYFGYRFFDSLTGRWLSRDPLAENGGVNLYAFCNNDLVNGVDGLGLAIYTFDVTNNDKENAWLVKYRTPWAVGQYVGG